MCLHWGVHECDNLDYSRECRAKTGEPLEDKASKITVCIDGEPETRWNYSVVSPRRQLGHPPRVLLESDDFPWLRWLCGSGSRPKDRRKLILNLLRMGLDGSAELYPNDTRSSTSNESQKH